MTGSERDMKRIDDLLDFLVADAGFRSPSAALAYCRTVFAGFDPAGKRVLEIGCGRGVISLFAAASGAESVVGLEPEADGSYGENLSAFRRAIDALHLDNVKALPLTLQAYDPGPGRFDLVVGRAVINHLDEEACITLKKSAEAQGRYNAIFSKIAAMMNPGGALVLTDGSPYSFWRLLGMRNPFAPTIEYHKHQTTRVWIKLLRKAGFVDPKVTWLVPRPLRPLGPLVGNEVFQWFTWGRFRLVMRRA
jgi:SAM-dependent methyltransferase